jgi:hypothetical protein
MSHSFLDSGTLIVIEKNLFFVGFLKATDKKCRIRIWNPVYGSKDPYKNVTDPEHLETNPKCF